MRIACTAAALAAGLIFPAAASAEPAAYEFDAAHTDITFTVNHLRLSDTHGRFDDFAGELVLDEEAPENSSVDVTIYTWSVDTGWEPRDVHLRGPDFFNVAEHPEMRFVSTRVETTGEDTARLHGDLTLLGETHPVTLDVTLNAMRDHPNTGVRYAGFTATGELDRSEWGMDWGVGNLGDTITIRIDAEATRIENDEESAD